MYVVYYVVYYFNAIGIMIFYEKSLDYKIFLEIKKLLDNWDSPSARKIALWLWIKENSTRTLQRKIKDFYNLWFIKKSETWRILSLTKAWKVHFWLEDFDFSENKTFSIPLIGEIACWNPIEAIEHETNRVNIWSDIISWNPKDYFLLKARWDSMDKDWIEDWDIVIIKKQSYADHWETIVALIDDSATLKEFKKNDKWYISLIPHSYNDIHKPIIMTEDFLVLWKYIKNIGKF